MAPVKRYKAPGREAGGWLAVYRKNVLLYNLGMERRFLPFPAAPTPYSFGTWVRGVWVTCLSSGADIFCGYRRRATHEPLSSVVHIFRLPDPSRLISSLEAFRFILANHTNGETLLPIVEGIAITLVEAWNPHSQRPVSMEEFAAGDPEAHYLREVMHSPTAVTGLVVGGVTRQHVSKPYFQLTLKR